MKQEEQNTMKSNIQKINLTGQKGITAKTEALADRQHQYSVFQKLFIHLMIKTHILST